MVPYDKAENPDAWLAWQCAALTGTSLFLTGKAGTGKTTFLRKLRDRMPKRLVVVAPTGVAAINAGGVTIHSFFQLPFTPYVPGTRPQEAHTMRRERQNLIRSIDMLVIDEISMVRADLLDAVDAVLRRYRRSDKPFGGVQLLMIGDLQQLSPVVTEAERDILAQHYQTSYFFGSKALAQTNFVTVELKRIYRQSDRIFVDLLNKLRTDGDKQSTINALNARYIPNFDPPDDQNFVRLTTHNHLADSINLAKLNALPSKAMTYTCTVSGSFPESLYPVEKELTLKVGAQVIFIKNDSSAEKRYYNGMMGRVESLTSDSVTVVAAENGESITATAQEWSNVKYVLDTGTDTVREEVEGTFKQIPLRPAWAITIHKSQGLTFDKVIIDAQNAFAHGQVYVALSRCRTLQGVVLSSPLEARSIVNDGFVRTFSDAQARNAVSEERLPEYMAEYTCSLVSELFDFRQMLASCHRLLRLFEENYSRTYPKLIGNMSQSLAASQLEIADVADKFIDICQCLARPETALEKNPKLAQRIVAGAKYFLEKIGLYIDPILKDSDVEIDNKETKKRVSNVRKQLFEEFETKRATLEAVAEEGFGVQRYLDAKMHASLDQKLETSKPSAKKSKSHTPSDVKNPELYNDIIFWRRSKMQDSNKPAYTILSTQAIIGVAAEMPTTIQELAKIKGIGKAKCEQYGNELLEIVRTYNEKQDNTQTK